MKKRYITPGGSTYDIYNDALRQPHLLIAGATGSGKSVIVNALIHAALLRLPGGPDGARLILIDPKRVELAQWRDMPHTVKYASEPDEMRDALDLAMQITEKRYHKMKRKNQKKLIGPDLFVVVDEFADLMTTQRRYIAPTVQRLAQIGRAARVHLIIATQSPIRAVIPTEIKCNFDARFGLRTRSSQDSRNIIERAGLETLPRYGQAVYMTPERDGLVAVPMVPDAELDRVAAWWTSRRCRPGIIRWATAWAKKRKNQKKPLDNPPVGWHNRTMKKKHRTTKWRYTMGNNIVNVLRREQIGTKTGYDFYNPDGTPVEESAYEAIVYSDWHKVEMTYEELCKDLGFIPEANFVAVTRAGTIYGTLGTPDEFWALRVAVQEKGYKMKSRKPANR